MSFFSSKAAASSADAPVSPAELANWDAAVSTLEACDKAAGITNPGTLNARTAVTEHTYFGGTGGKRN